jgi:hypothetical protein
MSSLDSLFSPEAARSTFELQEPPAVLRDSTVTISLDDEQFSPIALTSGMNPDDQPSESSLDKSDSEQHPPVRPFPLLNSPDRPK